MNGPTILFNGAAIYDFPAGKYLCEAFLPDEAKDCIQQVIGALPFSAVELYHDNNDIHALQPNDVTRRHLHITHSPTVFVDSMTEVPSPSARPFSPRSRKISRRCWTSSAPSPGTTGTRSWPAAPRWWS